MSEEIHEHYQDVEAEKKSVYVHFNGFGQVGLRFNGSKLDITIYGNHFQYPIELSAFKKSDAEDINLVKLIKRKIVFK